LLRTELRVAEDGLQEVQGVLLGAGVVGCCVGHEDLRRGWRLVIFKSAYLNTANTAGTAKGRIFLYCFSR
jgi:hypothetical protein